MYYNGKKELLKNILIIGIILGIAVVSTHYIYYKFQKERDVDYNSKSLDIVFHEKAGANITIEKAKPVTDSVGLSSNSYTFTVKNNLTEPVKFKINLVDDLEKILEDDCQDITMDKHFIKVSLKEGNGPNKIYLLSDLEDGTIGKVKIKALEEKDYTIRLWVDSNYEGNSNHHYHGIIKVEE
ncbi:MAG: hypothetical protein IJ193_09145 [Bacilli bacterium]|nr:hypothetical protein [Bacilli bacterium]